MWHLLSLGAMHALCRVFGRLRRSRIGAQLCRFFILTDHTRVSSELLRAFDEVLFLEPLIKSSLLRILLVWQVVTCLYLLRLFCLLLHELLFLSCHLIGRGLLIPQYSGWVCRFDLRQTSVKRLDNFLLLLV